MAIKTEIEQQELEYPILGIYPEDGTIVLFNSLTKGTLLRKGNPKSNLTVGTQSSNYIPFWLPFNGSLTLSNN